MNRSATEIMQEAMIAAVVDAIVALKAASQGMPNSLLRDLNAIHANTAFADLPPAVQATIASSVRSGFTRLLKEGYSVSSAAATPQPPRYDAQRRSGPSGSRGGPGGQRDRPSGAPRPHGGKPGGARPPRGKGPSGGRPGGGGGKPGPRGR